MNQLHPTEAFGPAPATAPNKPAVKPALKPDQNQRVRLTHGDARALHSVLTKGDEAVAQRKDLGDLYRRIVTMISTLDTGLSERQVSCDTEIHTLLSTRLDEMAHAINEVEGALRIEMEPLLRKTVSQAIDDRLPLTNRKTRPSLGYRAFQILALCTLLYLGSVFSSQIESAIEIASKYTSEITSKISAILPPDGGIGTDSNPVE